MHTPELYAATVGLITAFWFTFTVYQFDQTVRSYATYPHDITFNGTYWDKARYTLTDRLHIPRTLGVLVGLVIVSNTVAVLLVAGVVHLIG